MHNVVIIGGMAAGCRAASRLSRLSRDFRVTIIERGPFISFSSCGLPLYAAGEIDSVDDLCETAYGVPRDEKYFRDVKGVEIRLNTEVDAILADRNEVKCRNIDKGETFVLPYDSLLIATGSEAVRPGFHYPSSTRVSPFHSPSDAANFRKIAEKGSVRKAVVIGGGFVGCEMIEALTSLWGIETVLVEKEERLLSGSLDPELSLYLESCIKSERVHLSLSTGVEGIETDSEGLPVVSLEDGQRIAADYVFYCLGVRPNTQLARKSSVVTGRSGGILVDEQMRTSVPNIWAAGDCAEVENFVTKAQESFSFGSLSNRMGRVAADSIAGRKASFNGAAGAVSLKLFSNIVCAAGLTEKRARQFGYETGSVIGCWSDRPEYHPDAKVIVGKLVYEKPGLRLLGLQLIGEGEVTRYIDVFSELLSHNKTIADLSEAEHAYTPAHSSPISPLNYLGFMADSQETDGVANVSPLQVPAFRGIFVDVREPAEVGSVPFPEKSVHIPLSDLKSRVNELDAHRPVMFICEKGPRSYEATRVLLKSGHREASYLGGGNLLYNRIKKFSEQLETHS